MSLLADHEITELVLERPLAPMIRPFVGSQVRAHRITVSSLGPGARGITIERVPCEPTETRAQRVISYGLSSFGYDVRAAPEWSIFTPIDVGLVDPKEFDRRVLVERTGDSCIIPPNSYALTRTVELISMPPDVHALCVGKSTYARCGIIVNTTPIEAGWRGHITIEISNATPLPVKVYAHEGIAQLMFFRGSQPATTYADRNGKYQDQRGITPAKV